MSRFDDIFSRKAKEAFDSYDAGHLAGDGWNAFTEKYGRKRQRTLIMPVWGKAASIIILVTAGVLLLNRTDQRKENEPTLLTAMQSQGEKKDSVKIIEDTSEAITLNPAPGHASDETAGAAGKELKAGREFSGGRVDATVAETTRAEATMAETTRIDATMAGATRSDESGKHVNAGSGRGFAGVNLASGVSEIRLTGDTEMSLSLPPRKALNDYLVLPREKMTTTLMTGFSGMMASIGNETTAAQGVSVGFYVERQLTGRISIRPGLAVAKHNYGIESTPGGDIALGENMDFNYSAPELNGMTGTTTSFDAVIDVVSMEVPVNFVFSLWKGARSNLFISTGASTVFYLSQHMSGSFNNTYTRTKVDSYGDVSYESMTTTVKVERDQQLLSRVDFLGLANFSAGYSLPFGKGTHLLFEPFIQLPLKDLTSQNLRIRYGGLSMKMQF